MDIVDPRIFAVDNDVVSSRVGILFTARKHPLISHQDRIRRMDEDLSQIDASYHVIARLRQQIHEQNSAPNFNGINTRQQGSFWGRRAVVGGVINGSLAGIIAGCFFSPINAIIAVIFFAVIGALIASMR